MQRRILLAAYSLTAVIATGVCGVARECNNFHTFRWAFWNLIGGQDLYILHPSQHADLFKYSPTFALLFAPFALPPFALALLGWNLLNGLLLYYAVGKLLPDRRGTIALAVMYAGYLLTIDGTQSNGLVAALIVLAFIALERRQQVHASLAIAAGALVKLFPLAALSLALAQPRRLRFALVFAAVSLALILLPLVAVPPDELLEQYQSWWALERVDALDRGASVMALLAIALDFTGPNWPIQLAGTALLFAPLLSGAASRDAGVRVRLLASLLVYCVLFNHKAEQPTFIVAFAGIAIWHAISPRGPLRDGVVSAALILMVPVFLTAIVGQWNPEVAALTLPALRLAAVPCLVAWLVMQGELLGLVPLAARSPSGYRRLSGEIAVAADGGD